MRSSRNFLHGWLGSLALLAGLGHAPALLAAACANVATGNWSAAGTWAAPCNVAGGPTAADTVTIINNTTVTVNNVGMAASSVTINGGANTSTLTFAAGSSLAVTNNVDIGAPTAAVNKQITVLTGTLTVGGNVTATAGNTNGSLSQLTATSGSITIAGNVTLTGGTTATRDARLTVSSGLITINGGLTINATVANSSTASITAAGGRITVNGAAGVSNGDVVSVGAGTISVTNAAATFTNSNASIVASTTVSTGTLSVTGNLNNGAAETMTVSSTGNITVAGTLTNNGTITLTTTGTVNANGAFTNSATGVFTNTAGGNLNIGGNATMSGTFNRGTGTVTFNGTAAQTLGGTAATAFNNLTISTSGASNVSIACATPSPTVNATLALTSGDIITSGTSPGCSTACGAQVPIIVAAAGTITGGSSTSYVRGALRKLFSAGATLNFRATAGQDEFPVGDASNYTPVEITAGTTSTTGNVTACVTPTEHPQVTTPPVASGGINAAKSVNRYWSLATSTINTTAALVNAIFKFNGAFVSAGGDVDDIATTGNFIVEDWNGTSWGPTTLVAAGGSSTQASNIDLTGATNEFAIGEPLSGITAVPGLYNAFETSTPAGILGMIQTKVAGTGFSVDVVHINATKTGVLAGAITVEVRLLDSSGGGVLDVNGCNAAWPLIQALPNFAIPASGRGTIPAATVANSYRSVRFQIRSPVGGPYTQIGCSTDLFAIRPASLTISASDTNWQTAGTVRSLVSPGGTGAGGNVHAASTSSATTPRPFTLQVVAQPSATVTNYDGTPAIVSGFPTCVNPPMSCTDGASLPGSPLVIAGAWTGAGTLTNNSVHFADAGVFNLQLEDTSYASVDAVDGTPAATLTIPATATAQIGRFVPDHFDVTVLVAPTFKTFNAADAACSAGAAPRRTFTYIGQPFDYVTKPQATVIARNAAGATTANYVGTLWKIGGASPSAGKDCTTDPNICQFTTSWSAAGYSSDVIESYTYALTPASTPNWDSAGASAAAASVAGGAGTGTITYASSDTLAFLRATPQAPFTANITNTISVQDTSEVAVPGNGTIATTTAAAFSGIAFDSGNAFRYGRLQFLNAHGSQRLNLTIPVQAQYWNGSVFQLNAVDHCTALPSGSFTLGNYVAPLDATNMPASNLVVGGAFSNGVGSLTLDKPTDGSQGSVDVTINLGGSATANACPAWTPTATAANLAFLRGQWCGGSYDRDPVARATFGIYRNKFIYLRENY